MYDQDISQQMKQIIFVDGSNDSNHVHIRNISHKNDQIIKFYVDKMIVNDVSIECTPRNKNIIESQVFDLGQYFKTKAAGQNLEP